MARNDRIICRHPKPKPEDDWFMLDRWTPEVAHVVVVKYREVTHRGEETERIYKAFCSCGWMSLEVHHRISADIECLVLAALAQRARRKTNDRVTWIVTGEEEDSKGSVASE